MVLRDEPRERHGVGVPRARMRVVVAPATPRPEVSGMAGRWCASGKSVVAPIRVDEVELVAGLRRQDPRAWRELYRKFHKLVACGVRTTAQLPPLHYDDAEQEAWVHITRHVVNFKPGLASLSTWVMLLARTACKALVRRENLPMRNWRKLVWLEDIGDPYEVGLVPCRIETPEQQAMESDVERLMVLRERRLTPRALQAYRMVRRGMTYVEISRHMGVTRERVRQLMKQVGEVLADEWRAGDGHIRTQRARALLHRPPKG